MKKICFCFLIVLCFYIKVEAQGLTVKHSNFDGIEGTYNVDSNGVKNGFYYLKDKAKDAVVLKGQYKEGERVGNWYFYNEKNNLEVLYNYTQKQLLFLDSGMLKKTNINIMSDNEEEQQKASIPVVLCPQQLLLRILLKSFQPPRVNSNELLLDIKVDIIDTKHITYAVEYKIGKEKITQPLNLNEENFAIDWIPAMYNKKAIKSQITIKVALEVENENEKRFRWDN